MSFERIRVERDGPIVTLTLANPDKRNVLARDTMTEIRNALRATAETDALGVILAAEGPVFSAGHNFGDMLGATEADARELFDLCTEMMTLIQNLPQVVINRLVDINNREAVVADVFKAIQAAQAAHAAKAAEEGVRVPCTDTEAEASWLTRHAGGACRTAAERLAAA